MSYAQTFTLGPGECVLTCFGAQLWPRQVLNDQDDPTPDVMNDAGDYYALCQSQNGDEDVPCQAHGGVWPGTKESCSSTLSSEVPTLTAGSPPDRPVARVLLL